MKLARVRTSAGPVWVDIVDGEAFTCPSPAGEETARRCLGPIEGLPLLAPIDPGCKVVGLMDNFDGRKDRKGPGLFVKPPTTVIAPGETIIWPPYLEAINFECELAVVIGARAKNVSAEHALDHVLGYTVSNDVTSFPVLMEDGPTALSLRFKLYDTFLPLGPWIVTGIDASNLRLTAHLNGELKQDASTADMAFGVAETVSWVSRVMTLEPGDMISMGTPPGFVPMARGDTIACEIEGIGCLTNPVG